MAVAPTLLMREAVHDDCVLSYHGTSNRQESLLALVFGVLLVLLLSLLVLVLVKVHGLGIEPKLCR